jgi:hypothetical protein
MLLRVMMRTGTATGIGGMHISTTVTRLFLSMVFGGD